ncbi:MAG: phosphatidate cytidylyltransferase [Bacillota bacterium]
MLLTRVLSAAVGIPVLLLAVWYGGWIHFAVTALIMLFALHELNKIFLKMDLKPSLPVMSAGIIIMSLSAFTGGIQAYGLALAPVIILVLLSGVLRYPHAGPADVAAGLTGTLYIGLFAFFYLVRTLDGGLAWILTMLAATWAGDTVAYFIGKKMGKRKLAPSLSPGKTVEGALGGVIGSISGALLVYMFYPLMSYPQLVAVGVLVGITGILGDLFESTLKRQAGMKDTGAIIPGHGGVLDRFDSMIFTAPAVYYYVTFVVNH